jgi:hypothetical protein
MARPTKKEVATQNQMLLDDARGRMTAAQSQLSDALRAVEFARAILNHATEAFYATERRINPPKAAQERVQAKAK